MLDKINEIQIFFSRAFCNKPFIDSEILELKFLQFKIFS